jgi:hypothetical protein
MEDVAGNYIIPSNAPSSRNLIQVSRVDGTQSLISTLPLSTSFSVIQIVAETNGDRDGDGLLDNWETDGIDGDCDGTVDFDLAALGADPNHKDLFIEVDAMSGSGPIDLGPVVDAFADSPAVYVTNPDGQRGVTLHIIEDEMALPLESWSSSPGALLGQLSDFAEAHFGTPAERLDTATITAKKAAFRYAIFGARTSPFPGRAGATVGSRFAVLLGDQSGNEGGRDT